MDSQTNSNPNTVIDNLFSRLYNLPLDERELHLLELPTEIRSELSRLLAAHDSVCRKQWLEHSPLASTTRGRSDTESISLSATTPAEPLERESDSLGPIGRYQIHERIGSGSFADVYRAFDPHLGIEVALKVTRHHVFSEQDRARFLQEAQNQIKISHPNIVQVLNADFADDGRAYLVMEYISGGTLKDFLASHPQPDLSAVLPVIAAVADALAHAHRHSVVHRDLKPANILLDEQGTPKVADFGLAISDDKPHPSGEYAGTPSYMAPEQLRRESDNLHGATDLWALGVILYESLTGRRPFSGDALNLFRGILKHDPKAPRELDPEIPVDVERTCLQCLTKEATGRPGSASDVAAILRKHCGTSSRKRAMCAAAGGVLVVLFSLAIFYLKEEPEADVESSAPAEPILASNLEVGRWYTVDLETRIPRYWPEDATSATDLYEEETETLLFDSEGFRMLDLGEINVSAFRLEVTLQRNAWTGQTGVYLGYHDLPDGTAKLETFGIQTGVGTKGQTCLLRRDQFQLREFTQSNLRSNNFIIPCPTQAESVLQIEVRHRRVVSVKWDGIPVPPDNKVLDLPPDQDALPPTITGPFGFFNMGGAVRFRNVRIMIFSKEPV